METIWREFAKLIGEAMARHWIAECDRRTQQTSRHTAGTKNAYNANRSCTSQETSSYDKETSPKHE